jgi:hypothetical protein
MWIYDLIHFSAKFKGKNLVLIQVRVNMVLELLCLPIYIQVPQELQSRGPCNFMSFTKNHHGVLIYIILDNFYDYTQAEPCFTLHMGIHKRRECCHPALHNSYQAVHPYTNYNKQITLGSFKLHALNCTYMLQKTRMFKYKSIRKSSAVWQAGIKKHNIWIYASTGNFSNSIKSTPRVY